MATMTVLAVRRALPVILSLAVLGPIAILVPEIPKCLRAYLGYLAPPLSLAAAILAVRHAITGRGLPWWFGTWVLAFLISLGWLAQIGSRCLDGQ